MLVFTNMPRKMTEAWNAARSWQKEMDVWRFYGKDKIWLSITERHLRGQEYLGSCHGKLSHDKFSQKSCFGNEMAHLLYQSRRMDRVWKSMSRVSHRCERFGKDRVHCSWWRWIARYRIYPCIMRTFFSIKTSIKIAVRIIHGFYCLSSTS